MNKFCFANKNRILATRVARVAWSVLFFSSLACSQGSSPSPFHYTSPVPVVPTPSPPSPPASAPPATPTPPAPQPPSTPNNTPSFTSQPPDSLSVNENSSMSLQLEVLLPDGSAPQFFYQCPYSCPSGITISAQGLVSWTPAYGQAGVYDLQFVVMNNSGETAIANDMRITVVHVNRPPVINSVTILPDNALLPTELQCVLDVTVPDETVGDYTTSTRTWIVNGTTSTTLTGLVVSARSAGAGSTVVCQAVVQDIEGFTVGPMASPPYTIPQTPPVISSVVVSRSQTGPNTNASAPASTFRVGDSISCPTVAGNPDGNPVTRASTTITTQPSGTVVATKTGDGDISYTIQMSDAHQSAVCAVTVTDTFNQVSATSTPILIQNSAPVITSIAVAPDVPTAQTVTTGDAIKCVMNYFDPDGDITLPVVSFFNGGASRGSGVIESQNSSQLVEKYTLQTILNVTSSINADVRGNLMSCALTLTDYYGATATLGSSTLTIADHPPSIAVDSSSGPLTQTLQTGQTLSPVKLDAQDLDGDQISFVLVADSCHAEGIQVQIDATGLITANPIPGAFYPQAARDCAVSYEASANSVVTAPLTVTLQLPNHAPSISCTNTTLSLKSGNEDIHGNQTSAGQALGFDTLGNPEPSSTVSCTISDVDGYGAPLGGGNSFNVQWVSNTCGDLTTTAPSAHASWDPLGLAGLEAVVLDATHFTVSGNMGLHSCTAQLMVSDGNTSAGGLSSNMITVKLSPFIDLTMNPGVALDNGCFLSVGGSPTFSGGYQFLASPTGAPATPLVTSISSVVPSTITAGEQSVIAELLEPYLSQNVDGTVFYCDCTNAPSGSSCEGVAPSQSICQSEGGTWSRTSGNGFLLSWDIEAQDSSGDITNRTLYRQWAVSGTPPGSGSTNTDSNVYPWHPTLSFGWDSGLGHQAAPSSTCVKKVDAFGAPQCSGSRASIVAGSQHTCVLQESGLVECFGANNKKQLGYAASDGTWPNENTPVLVQGISGQSYFCDCSYAAPFFQTACPLAAASSSVTSASCMAAGGNWEAGTASSLAAGSEHNCALMSDQTVRCWGNNYYGQLGYATAAYGLSGNDTASLVVNADGSLLSGVIQIATGSDHSCALMSDSTVRCWGSDYYGQLGYAASDPLCPQQTLPASCSSPGAVQNGSGCSLTAPLPCAVSPGPVVDAGGKTISGVASIGAGGNVTCLVMNDGSESCYGYGSDGQLGGGSFQNAASPTPVSGLSNVFAMAVGSSSNCSIIQGGIAYCWGNGSSGQLGDAQQGLSYYTAAPATAAFTGGAAAIAEGEAFGCAVIGNGSIQCWGDNSRSQLGTGASAISDSLSKVNVVAPALSGQSWGAVALALGDQHACAVLRSGDVVCWGAGDAGQLGNGSFNDSNVASLVSGGSFAAVQSCPLIYQLIQQ